jgi:hypothetical protein
MSRGYHVAIRLVQKMMKTQITIVFFSAEYVVLLACQLLLLALFDSA